MKRIFKNIGTRSVLYGAHCFIIHPWFVAWAWWRFYGFPFDPRLWFAFFLHDIGYIGKPNMDGPEGELHPYRGALIMGALFGRKWFYFTLHHSRFLAKKEYCHFSKLCVADKLAFQLTPRWLYLPMVNWTGEIHEYMKLAESGKYSSENRETSSQIAWHAGVIDYMGKWIEEHRDLKPDIWTNVQRSADANGVYK